MRRWGPARGADLDSYLHFEVQEWYVSLRNARMSREEE